MSSLDEAAPTFEFRHEVVDLDPPSRRLGFCETVDLTGNGRPDVITGGTGMKDSLQIRGKGTRFRNYPRLVREFVGYRTANVFWYENPGWERHTLSTTRRMGIGADLADIDGDGTIDLVVGQAWDGTDVYWYDQPTDPRRPWTEHLITGDYSLYHDVQVADVDDDGEPEVVGLSQNEETIFYYDVPDDPTRSPWPDDHEHVVTDSVRGSGIAVLDVDGDGRSELVSGTDVYHRADPDGWKWDREQIVAGWDDVRIATADVDGDGETELILAEGDSPVHGTHMGRLAWVDPPDWKVHLLHDDLFCPHSLQVGDLTGDGRPDIYVAEQGMGEHENPRQFVFRNLGGGEFEEHVVASGIPTHEAKLVDMTGDGRLDVVGKPYHPERHVDVWYNETALD